MYVFSDLLYKQSELMITLQYTIYRQYCDRESEQSF